MVAYLIERMQADILLTLFHLFIYVFLIILLFITLLLFDFANHFLNTVRSLSYMAYQLNQISCSSKTKEHYHDYEYDDDHLN